MEKIVTFLTDNISNILMFIGGGGALALFTLPTSKKKAETETFTAMQLMYRQVIKDASEQLTIMRDEYNRRINDLQEEINDLRKEIESQRLHRCVDMECTFRRTI